MEEKAKVSISFTKGELEIIGSENFVKEQLDRFKDLINVRLSAVPVTPAISQTSTSALKPSEEKAQQLPSNGENPYPKVIELEEGKIRLLQISGKDKAEKTISIALLYLLAKTLIGEKNANFNEIRAVCKNYACLDSGNFAKTLKMKKQSFIIDGSSRKKTVKLSQPGLIDAKELAKKLSK